MTGLRRVKTTGRTAGVAAAVLVVAVALTACTGVAGAPVTSAPTTTPSSTPTADSTPEPTAAPRRMPGGTATQNKAFFDSINQAYFIAGGNVIPEGKGVIDNLVGAGFAKADMQLTNDRTAIGLPVDSLIFSILIGGQCLIGQFSAQGYSTIVAPKLTTGTCLVGVTRTIDW